MSTAPKPDIKTTFYYEYYIGKIHSGKRGTYKIPTSKTLFAYIALIEFTPLVINAWASVSS